MTLEDIIIVLQYESVIGTFWHPIAFVLNQVDSYIHRLVKMSDHLGILTKTKTGHNITIALPILWNINEFMFYKVLEHELIHSIILDLEGIATCKEYDFVHEQVEELKIDLDYY